MDVIKTMQEKSPTVSDIHRLRLTIKDPESYFEKDGSIKVEALKV